MSEARGLLPPLGRRIGHVAARGWYAVRPGERELPTYSIVGAKRGGTTSLDEYLVDHPLVLRGLVEKGCRYYDVNYDRGERWFHRNLPLRSTVDLLERRLGQRPILGESSPYYSFHPLAAARIAADLPHARLFFAMRDPVERAWSHYRYEVARGFETLDFEAAVQGEAERLTSGDDKTRAFAHRHFSYVGRSRYAAQLVHLWEHFPADQLMVVDSDLLFSEPHRVMQRVFAHVGLEPHTQQSYRAFKPLPGADGPPPRAAALLREHLRDDVVQLGALLDDPPRWLDRYEGA